MNVLWSSTVWLVGELTQLHADAQGNSLKHLPCIAVVPTVPQNHRKREACLPGIPNPVQRSTKAAICITNIGIDVTKVG